jgi:hypothetical protein
MGAPHSVPAQPQIKPPTEAPTVVPDAPPPDRTPADSAPVLERFRDADHRYGHDLRERPSWWDQFWAWVRDNIVRPLTSSKAEFFWKVIAPILAVLGVGWALYRLVGGEGSGLFARRDRRRKGEAGILLDVDDITTVDLEALLAAARADGRSREVVLFRNLRALQGLAAREVLKWRKDKTNRHYAVEVRAAAPAAAAAFDEASRVFAWVWYGDHPLDAAASAAAEAALTHLDDAVSALPLTEVTAGSGLLRHHD